MRHGRKIVGIKYLVIVALHLLISGCATAPPFWFNPHKSEIEAKNDIKDCDYEALKYSRDGSTRNELLYNKCMNNKGFTLVNSNTVLIEGNNKFNEGLFEEAILYYDRAAYDFPQNPVLYYNMGASYLELKKYDMAIKNFDKAINLQPLFSLAFAGRGWCNLKKGQLEVALEDFNKAISIQPKNPFSFIGRGVYYLEKKKYDNALNELNTGISLHSSKERDADFSDAYYYRGVVYEKMGKREVAIDDLKKSCDLGYKDGCAKYKKLSRE